MTHDCLNHFSIISVLGSKAENAISHNSLHLFTMLQFDQFGELTFLIKK